MIHYSCDRCRRSIDPERDLRYSLQIDLRAHVDGPLGGQTSVDDRDALDDLQEVLEAALDSHQGLVGPEVAQRMHFDLCRDCYRRFVRNPLGQEVFADLTFSDN